VRCLTLVLLLVLAALAVPAGASAASADLRVTKTGSPDAVSPNADITYTITVTNLGPDSATGVSLTDDVPTHTTFKSAVQDNGPTFTLASPAFGSTGQFSAAVATLASGASAQFTLVVTVDEDAPATSTIFNTASVSSSTPDPDSANDAATAGTDVSPLADLSVTKSDSPDPVAPGSNVEYTILLNNNGPNTARNLALSDTLPPGTTFVSATQPNGPTFTLSTPAVGATGTVTATKSTFAASDAATFKIVVHVGSGVADGTTLSNTASVTSDTDDPNTADNSDTETTLVNEFAELSVSKLASPDPVLAGNNITYTIEVSNAGPTQAQSVQLSDAVPVGTTFVSASQTSGPTFTLTSPPAGGTGTFTATRATLAVGATAKFTMVVHVAADRANGSTIDNTATIGGVTLDSNASNDSASTSTTVSNPTTQGNTPVPTPQSTSRPTRLTLGDARMRLPSGALFVPLTCEFSPSDVCITDVTVTFNTRKYKLDPLTVRNVHVGSGQTLDLYMAATHAQRVKMRRIGTIPVTVTATNPPGADLTKPGILIGLRRR
jgi:uncharacterized repeat protein (TIGR01451 family)